MFPPFTGITYPCVRSPLAPHSSCYALIALFFIVFSLRYFFSVDPETAVEPVIDYFTFKVPFLSAKQPGKPPPLINLIYPILLSTACIRVV